MSRIRLFYLDVSVFVSSDEAEELTRFAREFFGLLQEEKDTKISLNNQDFARGESAPLTGTRKCRLSF